jgi:hypothetical protein
MAGIDTEVFARTSMLSVCLELITCLVACRQLYLLGLTPAFLQKKQQTSVKGGG